MNNRISIFVGILLISSCQSVLAMWCYTKKLSSARTVRASLQRDRCVISIVSPLFIHAIVQAAQTTKHKSAFKKYVNGLVQSNKRPGNWTSIRDSKKFYEHVVTHLPWNGKFEVGDKQGYPVFLNEREISIYALCYQSKCVPPVYYTEVFAMNDDYWKDTEHHKKVCQEFKKLMHD